MSPSPLSPNSVHIVLQYIHPPSQLDQPLPPYLLSKPLLQRHHFLQIPPEETAEYLCWPADTSLKAIELLEALPPQVDDPPQTYPVRYTSDDEYTYAHVGLSPIGKDAVRLVFQWDELDGWKYHDVKLMPFPPGSEASLQDALTSHASIPSIPASSASPSEFNSYGFDHREGGEGESDGDDDYWNSYGADDSDGPSGDFNSSGKDTAGDSEDAYWARYASVHGTADSTIPSPPIQRRRLQPYADDRADIDPLPVPARSDLADTPGDILPILPSMAPLSRWSPASPKALARLLAEISPRRSPVHESACLLDLEDEPGLSPGFESTASSETASTDALGLITDSVSPSLSAAQSDAKIVTEAEIMEEDDEALRQSIKGLYALWRSSRAQKGYLGGREAFIRVVEDVVR